MPWHFLFLFFFFAHFLARKFKLYDNLIMLPTAANGLREDMWPASMASARSLDLKTTSKVIREL